MNSHKETPAEKIKRLSEIISPLTGLPLGLSGCGCPSNILGLLPLYLHICIKCGFEGSERLHQNCPGCYINLIDTCSCTGPSHFNSCFHWELPV